MTKDDIVKLAIEHTVSGLKFDEDGLVRFAKLIAEHEREACANICEEKHYLAVADAIMARGKP
jgi:hypothetical protein